MLYFCIHYQFLPIISMKIVQRKRIIQYSNLLEQPVRFNPFLFSRHFILWALLGIIGGVIAGLYWIVLEYLTQILAIFSGWQVIPLMASAGLLAGLIIHFFGDP